MDSMHTKQGLNSALFSLNMGAIMLAFQQSESIQLNFALFFALFFIFFRIKFFLGDSHFLEDKNADNRPLRKWGYFSRIMTWLLFSFSGFYIVTSPAYTLWFFIAALTMSSTWTVYLVATMRDRRHITYFVSNLIYILLFGMLLHYGTANTVTTFVLLGLLFVTMVVDTLMSNSLENLGK